MWWMLVVIVFDGGSTMRVYLFWGVLCLAVLTASSVRAEDAKKPDEKPAPPAAADTKPVEQKATETKSGVLSEKPVNAAEGVVAVLTVKSGDEQADKKAAKKAAKKGGAAPTAKEEKLNLLATGDVATKLTDLAKKSATVEVTGVVNADTGTMKVSAVTEKAAAATDTGKKHKGKKNQ
jgi:hypothetical protein